MAAAGTIFMGMFNTSGGAMPLPLGSFSVSNAPDESLITIREAAEYWAILKRLSDGEEFTVEMLRSVNPCLRQHLIKELCLRKVK